MEQIIAYIVAIFPALSAIIGCIITFIKQKATSDKVIQNFESVRREVMNTKQYEALKDQLLIVHQDNAALKKTINELLTKIDHIAREE